MSSIPPWSFLPESRDDKNLCDDQSISCDAVPLHPTSRNKTKRVQEVVLDSYAGEE
jgi:hypothetical protein